MPGWGVTQVALPTCCQYTPSLWGPLRPLHAGRLRGRCRLPASILSLSLALRSRGSSADSGSGWGACSARRLTSCPGRGAGPAPLRAEGSAIGWMPPEYARPLHARSRLPPGPPIPASRHRGQTGSKALRVTLLLQVKWSLMRAYVSLPAPRARRRPRDRAARRRLAECGMTASKAMSPKERWPRRERSCAGEWRIQQLL